MAREVSNAIAHGAHFVTDDGVESLARRCIHIVVVEHLDGCLQVAERRAAAFGQAVQKLIPRRFVGEVARDVVEHQHEPVQAGVQRRRDRAHRRHLHAQQLPTARAGDELRRGVCGAALQALLHALQRVGDERAVEHGVDRAAQADQLGAVGQSRLRRQRAELQPRPVVVEQHAAIEVADDDALRQLRHQRREAAAFLLDVAARQFNLAVDVGAQRGALLHQRIDSRRQRAVRGAAFGHDLARHVGAKQGLHMLDQARRRGHTAQVQAARCEAERTRQQQPGQKNQGGARFDQAAQRSALLRLERRGEEAGGGECPQREQPARRERGRHLAPIDAHQAAPSSSARTRAASSLVENGLVM